MLPDARFSHARSLPILYTRSPQGNMTFHCLLGLSAGSFVEERKTLNKGNRSAGRKEEFLTLQLPGKGIFCFTLFEQVTEGKETNLKYW